MNEFLDRLKKQATENPILALGVGAALLTAASKFLDSAGSIPSKRAYAEMMKNAAQQSLKK